MALLRVAPYSFDGSKEISMRILIFIILLLQPLQAQDCPTFKRVTKGDVVECSGAFFSAKAESKLKATQVKLESDNDKLKRELTIADLQIKNREDKANLMEAEMKRQVEIRRELEHDFKKGLLIGVGGTALVFLLNSIVIKASK